MLWPMYNKKPAAKFSQAFHIQDLWLLLLIRIPGMSGLWISLASDFTSFQKKIFNALIISIDFIKGFSQILLLVATIQNKLCWRKGFWEKSEAQRSPRTWIKALCDASHTEESTVNCASVLRDKSWYMTIT